MIKNKNMKILFISIAIYYMYVIIAYPILDYRCKVGNNLACILIVKSIK